MSTDDTPQVTAVGGAPTGDTAHVTMVPVKRYDVTLTLDDILTPLTRTVDHLGMAGMVGSATDPAVAEHLQRFNDLVAQLKDVVSQIDALDSTLLASKAGPPPGPPPSPPPGP